MNSIYEEEFNVALGKRLTMLRQSRKMSLDQLGACIGVRGQQIHKYETGENRIPPERLDACAKHFGVPVGFFFGEGESGHTRRFDKTVMNVAAEVYELPPEIRQCVYTLSRVINRTVEETALQHQEDTEAA